MMAYRWLARYGGAGGNYCLMGESAQECKQSHSCSAARSSKAIGVCLCMAIVVNLGRKVKMMRIVHGPY